MIKAWSVFFLALAGFFILDYEAKRLFLEGYVQKGDCVDFALRLNHGVAFSFFAFLGDALKWLQLILITALAWFFVKERYILRAPFFSAMIFAGALSNLYDRFAYGAVVDYIGWHCGFRWPVFNLADVWIDLGMAGMVWLWVVKKRI